MKSAQSVPGLPADTQLWGCSSPLHEMGCPVSSPYPRFHICKFRGADYILLQQSHLWTVQEIIQSIKKMYSFKNLLSPPGIAADTWQTKKSRIPFRQSRGSGSWKTVPLAMRNILLCVAGCGGAEERSKEPARGKAAKVNRWVWTKFLKDVKDNVQADKSEKEALLTKPSRSKRAQHGPELG